jgi:phage terminase large subunit GpA-like protein
MPHTDYSPNCPSINQAEKLLKKLLSIWNPPPRLTLSEWADQYRRTSREASSEIGQWITRPFQREPMDEFTNPRTRVVVIMSAVQMLKTEFILNAIGYVIHLDQGPMLVIQYRDTDCEIFSKRRLAPMLRDTPILKGLIADSKSRDSGNTITDKTFNGGHIRIAASASPGNLAALPIRFLFCDEVDKYPASAGPEGDPISLAEGRSAEFEGRSKEILTCSPTVQGQSRIEKAYLESDQREYQVPCPQCGEFQVLKWSQVRWDSGLPSRKKQSESAVYVCAHCKAEWNDGARWKAVQAGRYKANAPFNGVAGFRISALASLKKRLSQLVLQYLKQKDDPEQLKTFINTVLAETWVEKGEAPEWEVLLSRREKYTPGTVPAGGLLLTAGVDVQRDRIEVEIVAWGRNRESWSVEYRILEGRTSEAEVWEKLAEMVGEAFPHERGGRLPISRMFVDSGDGTTNNDVYLWVRSQPEDRVTAIKGDDRAGLFGVPVSQPSSVDATVNGRKVGLKLKRVAVSFFKGELYARLRLRPPTKEEQAKGAGYPPGYCHFPDGKSYGDEHFKQLTAEQLVTRKLKTGRTKQEWRKDGRNEALDCRNYARAAAWDCGVDQAQEVHWDALERQVVEAAKAAQQQPVVEGSADPREARPERDGEEYPWVPRRKWFGRGNK